MSAALEGDGGKALRAALYRILRALARLSLRHGLSYEAAAEIAKVTTGKVAALSCDVAKPDEIARAHDDAMKTLGRIDIVVNNAGTAAIGLFPDLSDDTWKTDLDVKLFAAVRLITARRAQALLVPEQAIFAQQGKPFVYKVMDGVARLTEVQLGGRSVGQAEITKGLAAGDVVVTAGQLKLHEGARVRLVEPDASAAGEKVS